MAVSLKDIAQKVDMSICSVSQVVNGHPRAQALRRESRERILEAARELGYCRNEMAASMVRQNSRVLALVTGDMGSVEYTGRIQNGILEAAGNCGYMVTLLRLNNSSASETVRKLLGWRTAGVVFHVADLAEISAITEVLKKNNIPWGTVNLSNPGGIGFTSDDFAGIREAVKHLFETGHKKLSYICHDGGKAEFHQRRLAGFAAGTEAFYKGQKPDIIVIPGGPCWPEILARLGAAGTDGVICESDQLAFALLGAARRGGLSIPGSFSLVGYGNSFLASAADPPFASIAQDFEAMGALTVKKLTEVIENKHRGELSALLPVKMLTRQSIKER